MNLKRWICLLLAVLLLAGCTGQNPKKLPASSQKPVTLAFATDLHFLSQSLTQNDEYFLARVYNGDGKALHYIDQITDAFVEDLLAEKPDALVLGGDLTLDGELQSHKDLAAKLQKLRDGGIPVLALSGNHDTNNFLARGFLDGDRVPVESPDSKQFRKVYGSLGYNSALSRDKDSMSYVYALRSDLWVLLLDVNESVSFNKISDNTYAWLEQQLIAAREQGATVVTVSHQNLLAHSPLFSTGYVISDADRVIKLYQNYGVPLNLSGHIHMQHLSAQGTLHEAVTSSLAVTPSQYALVAFDGQMLEYATKPVDVEGWAARHAPDNAELTDFKNTTHTLFWDIAYSNAYRSLTEDGVNEEHAGQMADFYAEVNTAYFQGVSTGRTMQEDAYALWERYEREEFRFQYITSMLESGMQDHNKLSIAIAG